MKTSLLEALVCEQEDVGSLDRGTIQAIQLKKLNRLLARERARGGFYRDAAERLRTLDGLADLPLTTRADLLQLSAAPLPGAQSAVHCARESDDAGDTLRIFYSENDIENAIRFYMAALGELTGPGGSVLISLPFSGADAPAEWLAEAATRLGAKPLRAESSARGALGELLKEEKPEVYVGPPAPLLELLRADGKGSLRRALLCFDGCSPEELAECEARLGSKPFLLYGSRETCFAAAVGCQAQEGMHLRENHVIAEILDKDGRRLPDGEVGELVITTIGLEAQPLIRYRTEAAARILPTPCPCGCALLRLELMDGA